MKKTDFSDYGFDELLKTIAHDENVIPVGVIAHIFVDVIRTVEKQSVVFEPARKKLSKEEISSIAMCLMNSFLTSIYVTASDNDEQFNERMSIVEDTLKKLNEKGADA